MRVVYSKLLLISGAGATLKSKQKKKNSHAVFDRGVLCIGFYIKLVNGIEYFFFVESLAKTIFFFAYIFFRKRSTHIILSKLIENIVSFNSFVRYMPPCNVIATSAYRLRPIVFYAAKD